MGGTTYIVPPLSLGALDQLQDRLEKFTGDIRDGSQMATMLDAAHASLKRIYPTSPAKKSAMVDLENMARVMEAIMDVSGLKRREHEANGSGKRCRPAEYPGGHRSRGGLDRLDVGLHQRARGPAAARCTERLLERAPAGARAGGGVSRRR